MSLEFTSMLQCQLLYSVGCWFCRKYHRLFCRSVNARSVAKNLTRPITRFLTCQTTHAFIADTRRMKSADKKQYMLWLLTGFTLVLGGVALILASPRPVHAVD